MKNKILRHILPCIVATLFVFPFIGACSDDSSLTTVMDNMKAEAEKYEDSEQIGDYWRVILNADRERYGADPVIENGDLVRFWFHLRVFSAGGYKQESSTFWSNDPEYKQKQAALGVDTTYWPVGPEEVRIGSSKLGLGLGATLPRMRERDTAYIFVPYNKVGDDNSYGILPKETSVVWYLVIDKVIKD